MRNSKRKTDMLQITKAISMKAIDDYRSLIADEMRKMGASDDDILLIHDNTILNSILRKRKPEDVAWAILQ